VTDAGLAGGGTGALRFAAASDICEAGRLSGAASDACEAGRDRAVLAALRSAGPASADVTAARLPDDVATGRDPCLTVVAEGCVTVFGALEGGAVCRRGGLLGFSKSFSGTSKAARKAKQAQES
jgi:hypothetical protein